MLCGEKYCRPVFSCWVPQRGVRVSKRRKCVMAEEFYLAVLNLYVRIKISVTTFDTNHSVTDSTQSIAASIKKLADSVVKLISRARSRQNRYVRRNDHVMNQFDVSR
jgi:hypothetical protein